MFKPISQTTDIITGHVIKNSLYEYVGMCASEYVDDIGGWLFTILYGKVDSYVK